MFVLGFASLAGGGLLGLLVSAALLLSIAWGLWHSVSQLKSTALSSFVVPTIFGVAGAVLTYSFRSGSQPGF
jgi:hypothetical protein